MDIVGVAVELNIIKYWAIWTAADDIVGFASNEDMEGSLNMEDMAAWAELWAEFVGVKVAIIEAGLKEVIVTLLVSMELVGLTIIGIILRDEGPTMVALACDKAAAKAPTIPVSWLLKTRVAL